MKDELRGMKEEQPVLTPAALFESSAFIIHDPGAFESELVKN